MSNFYYKDADLFCDQIRVEDIAREVGTPFYLYNAGEFRNNFKAFDTAFNEIDHMICYACKTNDNLTVLKILASLGAGADIVSGGELFKVLKAGFKPNKIVFAGVGKTEREIETALEANILMFNVESMAELESIDRVAGRLKKKARIAFRINPDIDPQTHPHIATSLAKSKFGISITKALDAYSIASDMDNIEIVGIQIHLGSQITTVAPFVEALEKITPLVNTLKDIGIKVKYVDLGGGLGVTYKDEQPPTPEELAEHIAPLVKKMDCKVIFEPGRYIAAGAGILVCKVLFIKQTDVKTFVVVDGAMNDLARPFIYDAYHEIIPLREDKNKAILADVVGGVCESTDYFARNRPLPLFEQGDYLALLNAGAYGFVMSSNYNSRPRVPEVMVSSDKYFVIRKRETYEDLIRTEEVPDIFK
jgi:diaminopimelate decarboxylase